LPVVSFQPISFSLFISFSPLLSQNSSCSPETPLLSQNSDLNLGVVRGGWVCSRDFFFHWVFWICSPWVCLCDFFFIGCFGFARMIFFFSSGVLDLLAVGLLADLGLSVVVDGFEMGLMGFD
jgi:hypothetical protein